ncbi:MAG: nicotinate-nucleotide adenylyltransferase [Bacilli bacterium]|nr:nicotinate-nucleotide adenylyltransferase [Bacilli bacterium]
MNKILIIGGSFDPIHNGHLAIADAALKKINADEVWFMPAKNPRWKKLKTSQFDRLKMVKLAIKNKKKYKLCDYEIKNTSSKQINYTINTMKALIAKFPENKFYYLIGTDQLDRLNEWKDIDDLANLINFVLINRVGYQKNLANIRKYNVIDIGITGPLISSTIIRNFLHLDVPLKVKKYIKENGLYLENKLKIELSEYRYKHSKRVANLAKKIAKNNNINVKKAYIAGILHDCAKELNREKEAELMKKYFPENLSCPRSVYHQFLACVIAKNDYNIDDKEIIEAMKYHATASDKMSKLAKIIYVADKIEPGRGYNSNAMIYMCIENINKGFKLVLKENLDYLELNIANFEFNKLTLSAYNKYIKGEKHAETRKSH